VENSYTSSFVLYSTGSTVKPNYGNCQVKYLENSFITSYMAFPVYLADFHHEIWLATFRVFGTVWAGCQRDR
jgi:hypothetical protein